jgi:fermentation-respiration switch protein FrsA (DUF1100 family)
MDGRNDVTVEVDGTRLAVWHRTGEGEGLAGPAGRPCIVMGHGLGATRDSGLDGFAEAFAAAGADVLAFDYRGFGASGGEPRQVASPARQREDYAAVIAHARTLDGVDPDRIVAWGTSFAGGLVFQVAAADPRIGGVIALTPASDGIAALLATVRSEGPLHAARLTALGLKDAAGAVRGRAPFLAPIVAGPGEGAVLTAPGALAAYTSMAGETWRNEVAARFFLQVGLHRPVTKAKAVRCPVLVQVADDDLSAPPSAQSKVAEKARAEVHHYPCDHFDVYPGREWFDRVLAHQLAFLGRHFAAQVAVPAAAR